VVIVAPPSKSHTLRALYFALLAKGRSVIYSPLESSDSDSMLKAICQLGAKVEKKKEAWYIEGVHGVPKIKEPITIDAGNSGIVYRFMTALAALMDTPVTLTGDESIKIRRPILPLLSALESLGAKITTTHGGAPITVLGPISGGSVKIDGEDSQPVSALLYALSFAEGPSKISVHNMCEKPWIALSLSWLDKLNLPYDNFCLPGSGSIEPFEYRVPGDFSSIAPFLALSVIQNRPVSISNLDFEDAQGDKILIALLEKMGALFEKGSYLKTLPHKGLFGISIDMDACIDLVPILGVIGSFCEGETLLFNAAIAAKKECNRLEAITTELNKMGGKLTLLKDGILIKKAPLYGASLSSYKDHRMAMALSIASNMANGSSFIDNTECVNKTYPHFFEELEHHFNRL